MRSVNRALKRQIHIKQEIDRLIQPRIAATIWDRAHIDLERIYSVYRDVPRRVSKHTDSIIFPTVAIYRALKKYTPEEAYGIMKEAMAKRPRRCVSFGKTIRADIVHCPYHKYLKELGSSELITLFCDIDDHS